MENNILVSIVVPVYNAEKFLDYSLKCIQEQSYQNIEIILVDDGSKDGSLALCKKYAEADPRIIVIHQRNGGPGKARNTGAESATGEWIAFVDSDDKIGVDYIQDLVSGIDDDVELVMARGFIRNSETHIAYTKESDLKCSVSDCIFHIVHDVPAEYFNAWCGPWGKMFKKEIITKNHLKFIEDLGWLEDLVFCFEYFNCIKNTFISKTDAYDYLIIEGSLTHKRHSWRDVKRATEAYLTQIAKLINRYPQNKYLDDFRCSLANLSVLFMTIDLVNNYATMSKAEKHEVLTYSKEVSQYLHISFLPALKGNKLALLKHLPVWVSEFLYKLKYLKK